MSRHLKVQPNGLLPYLLHLADNALVHGQRLAEWCSNGPTLEEDIAMANVSLDHIGQARLLYQRAAELAGDGASEDRYAYFREAHEWRNYTLLELPHFSSQTGPLAATAMQECDYATTIARNYLYSALMNLVWSQLRQVDDPGLSAIAAKASKEVRYHLRHSRDWLIRLGDGTVQSHQRMQGALNHLWPFAAEFWADCPIHEHAALAGCEMPSLREPWLREVDAALQVATLSKPSTVGHVPTGARGLHSAHLGFLLAEMQSIARAHPEGVW